MQLLLFALFAWLGSTSIDLDDQEGPDQLLKDFNAGFRAPTEGQRGEEKNDPMRHACSQR